MRYVVLAALLTTHVFSEELYSFSPAVGGGGGSAYSIIGTGRITAVRMWEAYSSYIYGFQLCYAGAWSPVVGYVSGLPIEMELFKGERIVQISGKHSGLIYSLVFTTNRGRSLYGGQPSGHSFNMYPSHPSAELRFISGMQNGHPTSFQAHWGVFTNSTW